MNDYALDMFRQMFLSVKRGTSHGKPSSAKPILLISIIDSIGLYQNNLLNISDEILRTSYDKNVQLFAPTSTTPMIVPFFHIRTEPFYEILWNDESRPPNFPHTPSAKQLQLFSHGAKLDDELWELLQDEGNRQYLRESIINQYFSSI